MSMSKSCYSEKDNSTTRSSPCLKLKMKKAARDTEWGELIRHQARVAQEHIKQEKETKKQIKADTRNALDSLVKEKELKKQAEQSNKQKEGEQMKLAKIQHDNEVLAKRQQIKNMKKDVSKANKDIHEMSKKLAKIKKEHDLKLEEKMAKNAKLSLEQERIKKLQKKTELRNHADESRALREKAKKDQKELREREKMEYNRMVEEHEFHQTMKEAQYKQFYRKCCEHRANLHRTHSDLVLKRNLAREQHINDFIQKGIENHEKKLAQEELMKKQKRQEDLKNTHDHNKSIILENEKKKREEREGYYEKVKQTLEEIESLNSYLEQVRVQKKKQKEQYRECLRQQSAEKERRALSEMKMSRHEKAMNSLDLDHYRNSEARLKSMVLGLSPNKYERARSSINLRSQTDRQYSTPRKSLKDDDEMIDEENSVTTTTTLTNGGSQYKTPRKLNDNDVDDDVDSVRWHTRSPEARPIYTRRKSYQQSRNSQKDLSISPAKTCGNEDNASEDSDAEETGINKADSKRKPSANRSEIIAMNRSASRRNCQSNLDYLFSGEQTNNNTNTNNKANGLNQDNNNNLSPERQSTRSKSSSKLQLNTITNSHNPITNPLPYTMQNPYIIKAIEKGEYKMKS